MIISQHDTHGYGYMIGCQFVAGIFGVRGWMQVLDMSWGYSSEPVLLDGHGCELPLGKTPVHLPATEGYTACNSRGEPFHPQVNWDA